MIACDYIGTRKIHRSANRVRGEIENCGTRGRWLRLESRNSDGAPGKSRRAGSGALGYVGDDNAMRDLSSLVETADGGLRWGV